MTISTQFCTSMSPNIFCVWVNVCGRGRLICQLKADWLAAMVCSADWHVHLCWSRENGGGCREKDEAALNPLLGGHNQRSLTIWPGTLAFLGGIKREGEVQQENSAERSLDRVVVVGWCLMSCQQLGLYNDKCKRESQKRGKRDEETDWQRDQEAKSKLAYKEKWKEWNGQGMHAC